MTGHNLYQRIVNSVSKSEYTALRKHVQCEADISYPAFLNNIQEKTKRINPRIVSALQGWFGCTLDQLLDSSYVLETKNAQGNSEGNALARFFNLEAA
ncbi:MAG: hypothetical protein AB8F95_20555 [Bacteroidia bacterium]